MSRQVPGKSFSNDKEAEEEETQRKDPPGFVPGSNPNEVLPPERNATQGTGASGHQRVVSSARHQDASPGAEPLSRPRRHPPLFIEQTRPGAVAVPGFDDDGLTVEEGYDDQATVASHEASTVKVVATAVDTEEESRIRRERDQFQHELDQACHERDRLRHILGNAPVVTPIVTTDRDEENGDENIHAYNHQASPPFWTKRRSRAALLLLLLIIVVGVVVGALAATGTSENDNSESLYSMGSILFTDKFTGRDEEDRFGSVVMMSRDGTHMAIGSGSYARVFQLVGKHWKPKGEPSVIETYSEGDQFGRCVDLNREGSILAVGGWNNDDAGAEAGHVKVYHHNGTDWLPMGQDLQGLTGDRFGWYISLSDDGMTLAVGATEGDPSGKGDAGYVRVYDFSESNVSEWKQLGSDLVGEASYDEFGTSVELSENGRRLAVGASQALGGRGRIRVFDFDEDLNAWQSVGQPLDGDNAEDALEGDHDEDMLGRAISLSEDGSSLAASAPGTEMKKGSVRVWELKNFNWTQKGQTLNGETAGDYFGGSFLSLSGNGNCLAVGANHYSDYRGKAYLYRWDNSQWKEIAAVSGNSTGDRLGYSVALSGDCKRFAVGAIEYDTEGSSSNGYVLVYDVLSE